MVDSAPFYVSNPEVVHGSQVRAARALLNWSIPATAEKCQVGVNTISRFEKGHRGPQGDTLRGIIRTFEENGVLFIDTRGGRGVLLIEYSPPL